MSITYEEAKKKIATDPEYIYSKRFNYSVSECVERFPDGAPLKIIAQALMMTEPEVEETFNEVVAKLKKIMKVEDFVG